MELDSVLGILWASTIDDLKIDLANYKVTISAHATDNSIESTYIVEITGVSGLCWVNGRDEEGMDMTEWPYAELTSALSGRDWWVKITERKPTGQYSCNPNLCFEIWNSVLLIEAQTVSVNGQLFNL